MTAPQDDTLHEEEVDTPEVTNHTPPVTHEKPAKFGPGAFQNGSKFGKGATNFNPPNKQRPGRAAGRGR